MKVALVGNPNTGKSTIFNALTGLNQKVGNFPGVTVDKKTGKCQLANGNQVEVIDLPGIYSLYPRSADEVIAFNILCDTTAPLYPDLIVFVADVTNLKRNLLLFTQVADLQIPMILALNMKDLAAEAGIEIDMAAMATRLGITIISTDARNGLGIGELKQAIAHGGTLVSETFHPEIKSIAPNLVQAIQELVEIENEYIVFQLISQFPDAKFLSQEQRIQIAKAVANHAPNIQQLQTKETILRYNLINDLLYDTLKQQQHGEVSESFSNRLDRILTHRVFGLLIFLGVLLVLFQSIFSFSKYPMDWIEMGFLRLGAFLHEVLPPGAAADLLVDGALAGLSGVVVFLPQIVILFAFIAILEDTGYMARVTFMMDKLMHSVGLNGKSVVPLISGIACAVPAIMATRTIENWKDRLITILVIPLMSCSARLPVYTLLISLVVPNQYVGGLFNLQGLALMGMYLIGFLAAILASLVMQRLIKSRGKGFFLMELPVYRMPRWSNIGLTLFEKSKTFVVEAGKVIVAVSIVLWALATYGPTQRMQEIEQKYASMENTPTHQLEMKSERLESSYAGILGHTIEPIIRPLGFDWKIGIALITSFAAREVFVGTMATIYSVEGNDGNILSVRDKMKNAKSAVTGLPVFSLATAFSLMFFYAFAMQCMSTLAVVLRETKHWKWPLVQLVYMTTMAYMASFFIYQLLA